MNLQGMRYKEMCETKQNSYGTIGISAAMQMEAEGLIREMKNAVSETVSGMTFTSGLLMDRPVVVAVSGEGKVNAAVCAEAMILRYGVGFLLNSGVAGNLSDTLSVGDVAIAADTVEHDYDISPLGYAPGMVLGIDMIHVPCDPDAVQLIDDILAEMQVGHLVGTVATGDRFIGKKEDKERIKSLFRAIACEMEGGAIGHVAAMNHLPFAVIRAISDNADGSAPENFGAFASAAAERSVAVTKAFLLRLPQ